MVVGFYLHQNMLSLATLLIAGCAYSIRARGRFCYKSLYLYAFHDRRVVRVRHQHVLRCQLVRIADHAKHAFVLCHAIDRELRIENLVATVFAIGLREHHQLHVGGVAAQCSKSLDQVVNFIGGEGQTKLSISLDQGVLSARQNIHMV